MGRVSKQPKIPPGGGFGRGCTFLYYVFLEGGGVGATWKPLSLHPCYQYRSELCAMFTGRAVVYVAPPGRYRSN